MIEGHTLRAFLDAEVKNGALFRYHELAHNLPGPAFLFASGAAFSIATCARWESYHRWSAKLGWRLARFAGLAALGYALHLTYFSLHRTLEQSTPEQLFFLFSLNILQCIAYSALLLQLLVILVPNEKWFFRSVVFLAIAIGVATPVAWEISQDLPWWAGTHLSNRWNSIFPLFPYAGFQMAGAAWACRLARARGEQKEGEFLLSSRRWGLRLLCVSLAAAIMPLPGIYANFWDTGPAFFFLRVGLLGWVAVVLREWELRSAVRPAAVTLLGRESLLVYAAHMVLLYGSAWNPDRNLLKMLGSPLALGEALLILVLLTGAMVSLCWAWNQVKNKQAWAAKAAPWSLAGYLAYRFVMA
jgi:hypothetical protein